MENIELISFQIISAVGSAKSDYLEALSLAKKGKFKEAKEKILLGESSFIKGHEVHSQLISQEANGNNLDFSLLLMHAEDQLMSAEVIKILVQELIELYEGRIKYE